jgi:hypothetical protein
MQLISSKVHGIVDYIMGAGLIAEPYLESAGKDKSARLLQLAGGTVLLSSLLTKYEASVFKVIPYKTHLILDIIAGLGLIGSSFYLGKRSSYKSPHLYAGAMEVLLALASFDFTGKEAGKRSEISRTRKSRSGTKNNSRRNKKGHLKAA